MVKRYLLYQLSYCQYCITISDKQDSNLRPDHKNVVPPAFATNACLMLIEMK
ncbi:MAG: hypothetical protein JNL32_04455 [Candidatus Kapabacteria bacterium]|nr:hypothetical protein [Candidatus Kapabacteria bacterium]